MQTGPWAKPGAGACKWWDERAKGPDLGEFLKRHLLLREESPGPCESPGQDGLSAGSKQSLDPVLVFTFHDFPPVCLSQPSSLGAAWSHVERAQARKKSPAEVTAIMGICYYLLLWWAEI